LFSLVTGCNIYVIKFVSDLRSVGCFLILLDVIVT
jgi:hypothetical protein